MRVPKRQIPRAQVGCGKAVDREEKGNQIATASRLPGIGREEDAPEKAQGSQQEDNGYTEFTDYGVTLGGHG